jgi:hypothetical protein
MANRIRLNHKGVEQVLKSAPMAAAVKAKAEQVAQNVRDQNIKVGDRDGGKHEYDLPVKVTMTTTDRAHANVTITHPAGEAVQAKHGALTKAAAQAGLDVKARKK